VFSDDSVIDLGEQFTPVIYVDGAGVASAPFFSVATDQTAGNQVCEIMLLTVGKYVELYAYQNEGGNQALEVTTANRGCWLSVREILD
jgi:hypothetical protein